jgi:hypothetical protein
MMVRAPARQRSVINVEALNGDDDRPVVSGLHVLAATARSAARFAPSMHLGSVVGTSSRKLGPKE